MLAAPALEGHPGRLGRHDRRANDDPRDSHKPRYSQRVQVPDRGILGGRVEEELVLWQIDLGFVGEDDAVGASSQRILEL